MKIFKNVDPTKDPILKSIVFLSIPMMVEMLTQNLFNLVDMYFVSKISYLAIGALVSSSIVLMVIFSSFIGLSTATGMYVASCLGGKKFSQARFYYSNAFTLVLIFSLLFSAVLYLFLNGILNLLGLRGLTRIFAYQYLSVAVLGLIFNFLFTLNNSVLRSNALPSLVVRVMVLTNILNAIFDPFFMFYLKLGIRGAALSTIMSVLIGICLQVIFLHNNGYYFRFLIRKRVVSKLVSKGVFASLHLFFRIVSMLVLIRLVSGFSQVALSAYSIVIRIYQVLLFLVFGLANTSFVVVGQNYGAKLIDRLKEGAFWVLALGFFFIGALDVLIYALRDPILAIFVRDPMVKKIAFRLMFFYFVSYPFVVLATISARSSMALHDTKRPSLINLFNLWFFMLPLAYVLSKYYGLNGIWFSIALSNFTSFLANIVLLLFNLKRVENEVVRI